MAYNRLLGLDPDGLELSETVVSLNRVSRAAASPSSPRSSLWATEKAW